MKLLPKNARSEDEQRGLRDTWWSELRDEVRAHARFLKCQFVIGYTESVTVNGGVYWYLILRPIGSNNNHADRYRCADCYWYCRKSKTSNSKTP